MSAQSAADPLSTAPKSPTAFAHGSIPNTMLTVAGIAYGLGITSALGLVAVVLTWPSSSYQLSFMVAAWSTFHFLEFAVTAGWNRDKLSVDSFLLNNGVEYHLAHLVAALEWLIVRWLWPDLKTFAYVSQFGIIITLGAQVLRSLAMVHAASNFSHQVAYRKAPTHELVTEGVYAWSRHPSYTGFFYWGLGMQLTLQNPISFAIFMFVLWRFFNERIKYEERGLVKFFGNDYVEYRKRVGTRIPFIP